MIQLQQLSLTLGSKLLFDQIDATIFDKDKIGIVGRNGTGKTTLFRLLTGKVEENQGKLQNSYKKIAHLEQNLPQGEQLALEYVQSGDDLLFPLYQKLNTATKNNDHEKIAEIHHELYTLNGYDLETRAAKIMKGLGFSDEQMLEELDQFSGGWKRRLNLAKILTSRADLLLLDEPTNHLDLDSIIWLIKWLNNYAGTVLIISHDRDFLDNTVNKILLLQNQKLTLYTGNYSDYEKQKALKLQEQQHLYLKQQKQIALMSTWIDRFRSKATKAKQVQSRIKFLEKMQLVGIVHQESPFHFQFEEPPKAGSPLIKTLNLKIGFENCPLINRVNFSLFEGEKIGILGKNGIGKSTLIKTILGLLPPLSGEIMNHPKLNLGYFDQQMLDHLDPQLTPYLYLLNSIKRPNATEKEIRAFLGGFGFTGNNIFLPVAPLSGGEKARLVLAKLIWERPNLLILDEPTNHLDLEMRESLTYALQTYSGALILVAHDRYLLEASINQFYQIKDQRFTLFDDTLEHYYANY